MRVPSKTVAGSSARPLRVISSMWSATRSTKVSAPGSVQRNRAVVVEPKVTSPIVRSSTTSYPSTSSSRALAWASARVTFMRTEALSTEIRFREGTENRRTPVPRPLHGNAPS